MNPLISYSWGHYQSQSLVGCLSLISYSWGHYQSQSLVGCLSLISYSWGHYQSQSLVGCLSLISYSWGHYQSQSLVGCLSLISYSWGHYQSQSLVGCLSFNDNGYWELDQLCRSLRQIKAELNIHVLLLAVVRIHVTSSPLLSWFNVVLTRCLVTFTCKRHASFNGCPIM